MLRSKQIGTISQCARSFLFSSSRCTADGASCTNEDEANLSKKSPKNDGALVNRKKSTSVSDIVAKGSSGYKCHVYQAPVAHVLSPKASVKSEGFNSLNCRVNGAKSTTNMHAAATKNLVCPTKLIAEQLTNAGVATDGVLSDLVNNGVSTTHEESLATNTSIVDSVPQEPHSRYCRKSYQRANKKGQSGPSNNPRQGSKSYVAHPNDLSSRTENSSGHKTKQNISGTKSTSSVGAERSLDNPDRRWSPHGTRGQSKSFAPHKLSATSEETLSVSILKECSSAKGRVAQPMKSSANAAKPVDIFLRTLRGLKWGTAAEEALGSLCFHLNPFQANQVLKLLHDHSVALGFFNWLKCQPGFKHDEHTYTTMVGILGRARQFVSARRLLQEMVMDGCQPNVVTYNRLIHGYGRANHIEEAMKVFYRMQDVGCKPDHVTFCTLIDIHAKAGYLDVALDLYESMIEAGLCPDTFTYSVMINCLGKAGQLPAAYKLFCQMIDKGCVPNLVTYNIMIALQAKARNYTSALELYRSMGAAGFRPDKITYSIVMEVLGHCGHLDEVEAVFAEMKQECPPDEPVYGLLVDLWGKAGKVDKARSWYQSMLDEGLRPNVPTCNSLLSAFLRVGRFSDAFLVLQNMLGMGLAPSLQTYTLLLSCCTEARCHMGLCCELMAITGHPAHTFLSTLPAAEPGGQNVRNHTSAFLDLMHSEDRESKRGLTDAVVDFLQKSGLKEEAGSVWEVAVQRNVYPDAVRKKSSTHWLVNLHLMSDGTAVIALSRTLAWFRRQILESGVSPDRIDIITGWGRRSRVTGSSLVRQAVSDLLHIFKSPFYTESRNSGCFVGCGGSLHSWLLHSYVERMHLL